MKSSISLAFTLIFLTLTGCSNLDQLAYGPDAFIIKGSMKYIEIEGGCWQFISDKGQSYELVGDNITQLHKQGIHAELVVRNADRTASICMIGKLVQVLKIINIRQP